MWSCYFFLRSSTLRDAALAGVMASLAAYCYPPARLAVPFILLAPAVSKLRERKFRFIAVTAVSFLILSVPLIHGIVFGELLVRFDNLNIFSSEYLSRHYGTPSLAYGMFELVRNLMFHLNPRFLFISGDFNLRHSTGWMGEP